MLPVSVEVHSVVLWEDLLNIWEGLKLGVCPDMSYQEMIWHFQEFILGDDHDYAYTLCSSILHLHCSSEQNNRKKLNMNK